MRVVVDGMGGDNAPKEIVKGTIAAVKEYNIEAIIVGNKLKIENELKENKYFKDDITVLNSQEVIENNEDPAIAIRKKRNASMVIAMNVLKEGKADGFISAGNTGAILAGGLFIVKRIRGIKRASIASMYPTSKGISLLTDAGANVDSKPEFLNQFATMASIYMDNVLHRKRAKVGLLNIGTEEQKGNKQAIETYKILKDNERINFIGNIEARDVPKGVADIILTDGFIGNIVLKLTEGVAESLVYQVKDNISEGSLSGKIGASLMKKDLKKFINSLDYREYGGAPLLGVKKPMIIAHGSSDAYAIKNAIRQCIDFTKEDVISIIEENI